MKGIFKKILYGFLFGLGLSASVIITLYVYENIGKPKVVPSPYKDYSEDSGLKLTYKKDRQVKDGVIVLGTIENQGVDAWRYITVEAEVFDKDGNFIDECTENINTVIKAGENENFKITCGACSTNKIPEYEKITLRINDARFVNKK